MKTAEELCVEVWNEAKKGLFPSQLVARIQGIQLDAYRAGMIRAAEICLHKDIEYAIREAAKIAQLP